MFMYKRQATTIIRTFTNYMLNPCSTVIKVNTCPRLSNDLLRLRTLPGCTQLMHNFHEDATKFSVNKNEEFSKVCKNEIVTHSEGADPSEENIDNKQLEVSESPSKPLVAKVTGRFQLMFTCKKCNTRNVTHISKLSYQQGVVIVCCQGCKVNHLIADNLKWFSDEKRTVEDILAEKGETVTKITSHQVFLEVVPPDTPDPQPKDDSTNKTTLLI